MVPVAKTGYGKLRGSETEGVLVFRGIPFAQPPVGELRWRGPQPISAWSGERVATSFGPSAMQRQFSGGPGT